MKPGAKRLRDGVGAAHQAEEGFLGDIFGAGGISEDALAGGENDAGIAADDLGEGGVVAGFGEAPEKEDVGVEGGHRGRSYTMVLKSMTEWIGGDFRVFKVLELGARVRCLAAGAKVRPYVRSWL